MKCIVIGCDREATPDRPWRVSVECCRCRDERRRQQRMAGRQIVATTRHRPWQEQAQHEPPKVEQGSLYDFGKRGRR